MTFRFRSGGASPPIYEKERALRMARKLGLRLISKPRADAPEPTPAEDAGQNKPKQSPNDSRQPAA